MKTIYLIAGEKSGDLFGKELMLALKAQHKDIIFKGIGGELMVQEGLIPSLDFNNLQVMGFTDVILNFKRLYKTFYSIGNEILKNNPDSVIFIDYPGFNLRLGKYLKKNNYKGKLIHTIAPTVWAWGKGRAQSMSKTLNLLFTLFPYETHFFEKPLKVKFIGHPLANTLSLGETPSSQEPLLALFPGSREGEIKRNLSSMLLASKALLKEKNEFEIAISCGIHNLKPYIEEELSKLSLKASIVNPSDRYDLMKKATVAIAKSGTVVLELALLGKPTVVIYHLSKLNYFLIKYLLNIKVPYISLPNLLLNKTLFPEMVGLKISPETIKDNVLKQLDRSLIAKKHAKELHEMLYMPEGLKIAAIEILS